MNEDNTFDVEKMKNTIKHIQERNPELYNNLTKLLDECKAEGAYSYTLSQSSTDNHPRFYTKRFLTSEASLLNLSYLIINYAFLCCH